MAKKKNNRTVTIEFEKGEYEGLKSMADNFGVDMKEFIHAAMFQYTEDMLRRMMVYYLLESYDDGDLDIHQLTDLIVDLMHYGTDDEDDYDLEDFDLDDLPFDYDEDYDDDEDEDDIESELSKEFKKYLH